MLSLCIPGCFGAWAGRAQGNRKSWLPGSAWSRAPRRGALLCNGPGRGCLHPRSWCRRRSREELTLAKKSRSALGLCLPSARGYQGTGMAGGWVQAYHQLPQCCTAHHLSMPMTRKVKVSISTEQHCCCAPCAIRLCSLSLLMRRVVCPDVDPGLPSMGAAV